MLEGWERASFTKGRKQALREEGITSTKALLWERAWHSQGRVSAGRKLKEQAEGEETARDQVTKWRLS